MFQGRYDSRGFPKHRQDGALLLSLLFIKFHSRLFHKVCLYHYSHRMSHIIGPQTQDLTRRPYLSSVKWCSLETSGNVGLNFKATTPKIIFIESQHLLITCVINNILKDKRMRLYKGHERVIEFMLYLFSIIIPLLLLFH